MARLAPLVALIVLVMPSGVRAGDLFTGGQLDDESQYFTYLGAQEDLPWKAYEFQPYVHLFAASQEYEYESGGADVEAEVQYLTPALGVRRPIAGTGWSVGAFAGPRLQWKREEGLFVDSDRDFDVGVIAQIEPMYWQETHSLHGIFSYSSLDDFFLGRVRGKGLVFDPGARCCKVFAGADVSLMGNDDYDAVQVGPLLEVAIGRFFLLARGGYQRDSTFDDLAYAGIELYTSF
jgi:hypothetical protein